MKKALPKQCLFTHPKLKQLAVPEHAEEVKEIDDFYVPNAARDISLKSEVQLRIFNQNPPQRYCFFFDICK